MQLPAPLRVLVIQDNPILQTIACNLATCCGMHPRPANGQPPAQVIAEQEPETDLLIIGLGSLLADDRAALQYLRQDQGLRMPCIVHLPDNDDATARQARELGVPMVLPRIFSSQALQDLAAQAVESVTPAYPVRPAAQATQIGHARHASVPLGHPPREDAPGPSRPAGHESATSKARRLFLEGRRALKTRDLDLAIASFSKILAMRGRYPDACRGLAIAWQRKGNLVKFNHYLNKAAEGYLWRGHPAEAEKLYREMQRARCQAVNPYQTVAEVALQRGKPETALALYEKACALDPDDMTVRVALARVCRMLGRGAAALELVTTILQQDGSHDSALALYAELAGAPWRVPAGAAGQKSQSAPSPAADSASEIWDVDALATCEELTTGESALPLAPMEPMAPTAPTVSAESVAASSVPTRQGPRKVLIVDDEPHIRMLLEETLESLEDDGVVLLYAENGEDGLALIRQEQPSLVFLDVMMPRMNGFDVCDWTKNKLALDGVYVVMLTAKGQEFDSQRGMEAGADVYMTKPFRPAEVLTLARTVLGME